MVLDIFAGSIEVIQVILKVLHVVALPVLPKQGGGKIGSHYRTLRAILRMADGVSPNLHRASQCWLSSENRM